MSWMIVLG